MVRFVALPVVLSFAAAVFAQNPFADIPDLSQLGICPDACKTISDARTSLSAPNADLSHACTPTFATETGGCIQCVANSVPAAVFPDSMKIEIRDAIRSYEDICKTTGSPVTVDLGPAFANLDGDASSSGSSEAGSPTSSGSGSQQTGGADNSNGFTNFPTNGAFVAAVGAIAAFIGAF